MNNSIEKETANQPIIELEINIDDTTVEKCVIYQGETPENVAQKIIEKYNLNKEEGQLVIDQLKNHF